MNIKRSALGAMYGIFFSTVLGLILLAVTINFLIQSRNKTDDVSVNSIQTVDASNTFIGNPDVKILPVSDSKSIQIDNEIVNLGQSYEVMTRYGNSRGTLFDCSEESCEIYEILSESGKYFYISALSEIKLSDATIGSEDSVTLGNYSLKSEELNLFNSDVIVYRQVYGCLSEKICVHSGSLYIDDQNLNSGELNEFQQFLNTLQFSNGE